MKKREHKNQRYFSHLTLDFLEREKLHVRLDKIEQIFYINSGDFIPKSRKYKCTNGAQTLVVWAFSNFVENLRTTISKKSIIIL